MQDQIMQAHLKSPSPWQWRHLLD